MAHASGHEGDFVLTRVPGADAEFCVNVQAFADDGVFGKGAGCAFHFADASFARDEVPADAEEVAFSEFNGDRGLELWVWGSCDCDAPLEALDEAVLAAGLGEKSIALFKVLLRFSGERWGSVAHCVFISFGEFGDDQLKICGGQEDLGSP